MRYEYKSGLFRPWFLLTFVPVLFLTVLYYYRLEQQAMFSDVEFWVVLAIVLLPLIFLLMMKLRVVIDQDEVRYRYFPVHWKDRVIKLKDIKDWHLVFFDPIRDFRGYGYRKSKKYGTALITQSNTGLFIETNKGQRITLEIRDLEQLKKLANENNLNLDTANIRPIKDVGMKK